MSLFQHFSFLLVEFLLHVVYHLPYLFSYLLMSLNIAEIILSSLSGILFNLFSLDGIAVGLIIFGSAMLSYSFSFVTAL